MQNIFIRNILYTVVCVIFVSLWGSCHPALAQDLDTEQPVLVNITRAVFPDPQELTVYDSIPAGPYRQGPLYYVLNFNEPVSGISSESFYVNTSQGCIVNANPSACARIDSVRTLSGSAGPSSQWVVSLDTLAHSGTVYILFQSNIQSVLDHAGNILDIENSNAVINGNTVSIAVSEYYIDTQPLVVESFGFNPDGSFGIIFNKTLSGDSNFFTSLLGQFSMKDISDNLNHVDLPIQSVASLIDSNTVIGIVISFISNTISELPKTLLQYRALPQLPQITNRAGVPTASFSVETRNIPNEEPESILCSPIESIQCITTLAPDAPFVDRVEYITQDGSAITNQTYRIGDAVYIRIHFSEILKVSPDFDAELSLYTGNPNGSIGLAYYQDSLSVPVVFLGQDNSAQRYTQAIIMKYIVQPGDLNPDLDVSNSILTMVSGIAEDIDEMGSTHTFGQDSSGNMIPIVIPSPYEPGSLSSTSEIVIDGSDTGTFVPTRITGVSIGQNNGTYNIGDMITIYVQFSNPIIVDVTGDSPVLVLNASSNAQAIYNPTLSDLQNGTLAFTYTVETGDVTDDLGYSYNNALIPRGSTINDAGNGSPVSLSLPDYNGNQSLAAQYAIRINTIASVDTTPPDPIDPTTINLSTSTITNDTTPTLYGFAGSAEPEAQLSIYNNNVVMCTTVVQPDGAWSCTVGHLVDGIHSLFVIQKDEFDNTSQPTPVSVTIDSQPPIQMTHDSTYPISGTHNNPKPYFYGSAGSAEGGGTVIVKRHSDGVQLCSTTVQSDGSWACRSEISLTGEVVVDMYQFDTALNASQPLSVDLFVQGSPTIQSLGKKIAHDPAAGDWFGSSVAIDGSIAVVGSYNDKVGTKNKQGSVSLLVQNLQTGGWDFFKKITSSDGAAVDYFGNSIALTGDTIAVGAFGANIGTKTDQGAVYIFEKNAGGNNSWGQVKKIYASDGFSYDYFGHTVSLQGDRLLVGANKAKIGNNNAQGAVYVYERNNGGLGNWGLVQKITLEIPQSNAFFGTSIDQFGDTIVVGAQGVENNRGAVFLYTKNTQSTTPWVLAKKITPADRSVGAGFGTSVSLQENYLVVGAPNTDQYRGSVYLFHFSMNDNTDWVQVKKYGSPQNQNQNDRYGARVMLRNGILYISSTGNNNFTGTIYRYAQDYNGPNTWGFIDFDVIDVPYTPGDQYGQYIHTDGVNLIVGVPLDDDTVGQDQGSVFLYSQGT